MTKETAKYRKIFEHLRQQLRDGAYPAGVPLPSEESLVRKYKVSRITAVRAMDELVKYGLVYRKRGAGTFASRIARLESGRLGLIMPSLAFGEVFPEICQALMHCARNDGYSLVLGDISAETPAERAVEAARVARSFVEQGVVGVFLQPLAFLKTPNRITREIMALFAEAKIPVVLIDREVELRDNTIRFDFVAIDNFSAGRMIGAHLKSRGAKRVRFLMRPNCAPVIRDRLDGVVSAIGGCCAEEVAILAEPDDVRTLGSIFMKKRRPDAVVCESDYVAAVFRNTLAGFSLSVPEDVMLAGFDDVRCAVSTIPPLTTIHQPCEDIALFAYRALKERFLDPDIPSRRIQVPAPLVVRGSTLRR